MAAFAVGRLGSEGIFNVGSGLLRHLLLAALSFLGVLPLWL